jgi:hypothetical protein
VADYARASANWQRVQMAWLREHADEFRAALAQGAGTVGSVFAVVLTGPPGAGKSAVLTALSDALGDDGVPHASVEVEALGWTHPPLVDEQRMRHVALACGLHREAGHGLLLVAQTVESDAGVARLLNAVGADEHLIVRLEARPATLVARLVEREPADWSGLAQLIEHTRRLAVSMPALLGADLVLSTEGQRPETVAERIRAACPDRLRASGTERARDR